MKKKSYKWLIALSVFFYAFSACAGWEDCQSLSAEDCPVLKDFQVFDSNSKAHFNHYCSSIESDFDERSRNSYVLFQSNGPSATYKALALAVLRVGWLGIRRPKAIYLDFMEIKIQSLWRNTDISFVLEMKNNSTQQIVRSNFVRSYLKGPSLRRHWTLNEKGILQWYDFLEPEEEKATRLSYPNHPVPYPAITAENLPNLNDEYRLALIIKNNETQEEVSLSGPLIEKMETLFNIKRPEPEVLGFFDTLNPFQRGGIWDVLSHGWKYDKCIYLRKKPEKNLPKLSIINADKENLENPAVKLYLSGLKIVILNVEALYPKALSK